MKTECMRAKRAPHLILGERVREVAQTQDFPYHYHDIELPRRQYQSSFKALLAM